MDRAIVIWCGLAPLVISAGSCLLAVWIARSYSKRPSKKTGSVIECGNVANPLATVLVIAGWTIAAWVALWGRQGVDLQSAIAMDNEAWQNVLLPIGLVALAIVCCQTCSGGCQSAQWIVAGLGTCWIAFVAMPSGDAWQDVFPLHRTWMLLVTAAGLLNAYAMHRMARLGAERWVAWIALAGLAAPTMFAGSVYGGLAEWMLSACVATGTVALLAILPSPAHLWNVIYPSALLAACATASCRFYDYREHPAWLYFLILFIPVMIAAGDGLARKRGVLLRLLTAVITAVALLVVVAWMLLFQQQYEW